MGNLRWNSDVTVTAAHVADYAATADNATSATRADTATQWNGKNMPTPAAGVLSSDAGGNLSWATPSGGMAYNTFDNWSQSMANGAQVNRDIALGNTYTSGEVFLDVGVSSIGSQVRMLVYIDTTTNNS
jgi:hypothetical protein